MAMPPPIKGILETPVYVDDLAQSHAFYNGILGLERMLNGDRINAYDAGPSQTLLVFLRGVCEADTTISGQLVPGHSMDGVGHFAFRIDKSALACWVAYLEEQAIAIESRVTWPAGGQSIYFRDPFDNVVELATADLWPNDPDKVGSAI